MKKCLPPSVLPLFLMISQPGKHIYRTGFASLCLIAFFIFLWCPTLVRANRYEAQHNFTKIADNKVVNSTSRNFIEVENLKIAFIGSSTAVGRGASSPDKAFVNLVQSYYLQTYPNYVSVNLAASGYDTYRLLPTGSAAVPNRPAPDTNRNITAALATHPTLIVCNIPSNDVALGYTNAEYMNNLKSIRAAADAAGVPIFITTTQPRNFTDPAQRQQLQDQAALIRTEFSSWVIDIYDELTSFPSLNIKAAYNSGDGIHLNDAGHAYLAATTEKVIDKYLLDLEYQNNTSPRVNAGTDQTIDLPLNSVTLTGTASDNGSIAGYSWTKQSGPTATLSGANTATLKAGNLVAGTYLFRLTVTDNLGATASDEVMVTVNAEQTTTPQYSLTVNTTGSGTVSKSPNQTSYASGANVTLTASAASGYKFSSWSGSASGTTNPLTVTMTSNKSITANFIPVTSQQVVSFTLMNAATDQPIRELVPNETLNLATLPTKYLNIRANTNPATVGSVKLALSGKQTKAVTETATPYALFGDSNGNYYNWTPAVGSYTLKATPYTQASGGGTAGTSLSISFSVVNQTTTASRIAATDQETRNASKYMVAYPTPTTNGQLQVELGYKLEGKITYSLLSATGIRLAAEELSLAVPTSLITLDFSRRMQASGVYYLHLQGKDLNRMIRIVRQ